MTEYQRLCQTKSDINEHLPILKAYAEKCDHITEFGVRDVVSTYAFIEAKVSKIECYDINDCPNIEKAKLSAMVTGTQLRFHKGSTISELFVTEKQIGETDFLFIDTLHTAGQLKKELYLHAPRAKKYIGFHDVHTFGYIDERPGLKFDQYRDVKHTEGLMPVILQFLFHNRQWRIDYFTTANNGLMILKNVNG